MPTGRHVRTSGDRATFGSVLRDRVFALLFVAEIQSLVGDQLARVALSVLVFEATGSAPATAATYAATLLPALFGGAVVARIGDRLPRRHVMVGCDLFRAGCFAAMLIPGLPLVLLVGLVVVAVVLGPVFSAAEVSFLAARLGGEQFRAASGLRMIATQSAQVGGFVFGGVLVSAVGAYGTLGLDAASFGLSALIIGVGCRRSDPPRGAGMAGGTVTRPDRPSVTIWRDRRVRRLVLLAMVVGFFVVPEGLAVPLAEDIGAVKWQLGALLASGALGGAVGAVFVVRGLLPKRRLDVCRAMAVLCGLPLLLTPAVSSWPPVAASWFVSGFLAAYVVEVSSVAIRAVPDIQRSAFVGTMSALMLAAQGLGLIAFGLLAQWLSPASAIALAGACGSASALVIGVRSLADRTLPATAEPTPTGHAPTGQVPTPPM